MRRLIALLEVRRTELATFRAYEHTAARIMRRHGGELELAYELAGAQDTYRELHVVRFPDDAALAAYRADPELVARSAERDRAVISTEVWSAEQLPPYGS